VATTTEIKVPDIGDFTDVPIIEISVSVGDLVSEEDPLITLESDKATMDVPSPAAGRVQELRVALGDRVSEGTPILVLEPEASGDATPPSLVDQQEPPTQAASDPAAAAKAPAEKVVAPPTPPTEATTVHSEAGPADFSDVHAGPSVRRLARELDVDIRKISGTGDKGRITKEDLLAFVRGPAAGPAAAAAPTSGIPEVPLPDFSQFGPIEVSPLPRIKRISGPVLHRSWLNVPHVTHNDDADITDLDAYRKELDAEAKPQGYRVTLLAFLLKAAVAGLKEYPAFNSSLTAEKDALTLKQYYHLGVAVDTPGGLVVPVLRDVDRKGIVELSRELGTISARARDGKLSPADMSGATFTISSLGGIGGKSFTPIVNSPEVAILGVVRSSIQPVWNGKKFKPRLMLPLSLSYDHRVIDGALAARFARHLCHVLEDVRRLTL
jgi:pyruvate dehydrogenase E2 component (dihydrolipoamide acetyltransferase)